MSDETAAAEKIEVRPRGVLRKLYYWVLSWAESPRAGLYLFLLAFAESSFFPVPPDVLLIALALSIPTRAFRYALICSIGSIIGGAFGYLIGLFFMDTIGWPIINFYGLQKGYEQIGALYNAWAGLAVFIAGFTPIPYKVFTIAAGVFKIDFIVFMVASIISRSARFFLVAALIWKFGRPIRDFIDRYLGWLTILFCVLLAGGFILLKNMM
jgi:membrane protein YqaA with SNARE-associated domain